MRYNSSVSALLLLFGHQDWHPLVKDLHQQFPTSLLFWDPVRPGIILEKWTSASLKVVEIYKAFWLLFVAFCTVMIAHYINVHLIIITIIKGTE